MSLNRISAAEAASLIKHGYNIGLSGFTPAGTAKAVTAELAKIAEAEHAKGNPFQVGIFTGASTGESCDGVLSRAKAIRYRAPYTTNADFRKAVNNGEIAYNDIHLSQMAQEVRYGFMGKVNVAIIEACEVTPDGKIYLTAAGGIAPTICRLADQIIVELNTAMTSIRSSVHDLHDDSIALKPAVEDCIRPLKDRFAVSCDYDFSERMSRDVKLCFIGVIKEALSNTAKHSDGDSIKIIIREHPALYQLSIADNGSCPEKIDESGMGLANMRERAASLNGNINITSGSKGFRIFLSVPKQNLTERRS